MIKPGLPDWAVYGDESHRRNLICSIILIEPDLERHNIHLNEKYARMTEAEQRADCFQLRRRGVGRRRVQHAGPDGEGRRPGAA